MPTAIITGASRGLGLALAGLLLLMVALAARRRLPPAPAVVTKERAEIT